MKAQLIDGKAIAKEIREETRARIEQRLAQGLMRPGLATVLVGADEASKIYVRNKRRACDEVGIESFNHDLPSSTTLITNARSSSKKLNALAGRCRTRSATAKRSK